MISFLLQSLASIATLYVLEYHRRHSHHQPLLDTQPLQTFSNHNTHSSPVYTNSPLNPFTHSMSTSGVTYHDPQSIMQSTDKRHNPNRGMAYVHQRYANITHTYSECLRQISLIRRIRRRRPLESGRHPYQY